MFGNKGSKKPYRQGGTRGGQDQFKWEDVKQDKYRENYLGHSVNAPTGRWMNGKDILWYSKAKSQTNSVLEEEKKKLKDLDEDLINEALGITKKRKVTDSQTISNSDLKTLLSKDSGREEPEGEKTKGLGSQYSNSVHNLKRKRNN